SVVAGSIFERLTVALPTLTFRHRRGVVATALLICAAGAVALFGVPSIVPPMAVGTDTLNYIDPHLPLRRDLAPVRQNVGDLNVAHVWLPLPRPTATDPEVLRVVDRFQTAIAGMPAVIGVAGPTTSLRLRRYFAGRGEKLPEDPAEFARGAADLEQLLLSEPGLRRYIDANGLQDLNVTVLFGRGDALGYAALSANIGL